MHVPTAPALILGSLLTIGALDAAVLSQHHSAAPRTLRVSASAPIAQPVAETIAVPPKPALPRLVVRHATPASHPVAAAPRPHRAAHRAVAKPTPRVHRSSGTTQADLTAAVRHLPGYQPGTVRWVLSSHYGRWGTADWYGNVIYISPQVPHRLLRSVVIHEWDHILSVRDYGGDVNAAVAAMNQLFGGSGLVGAERAADCMALLSGATWTHYTTCTSEAWRAGARLLLQGRQL